MGGELAVDQLNHKEVTELPMNPGPPTTDHRPPTTDHRLPITDYAPADAGADYGLPSSHL